MTPGPTYLDDPGRPVLRTRDRPSNMVLMAKDREESLDTAVRGYASEVTGCAVDRITSVTRLRDGNRDAVYRVTVQLVASGAQSP